MVELPKPTASSLKMLFFERLSSRYEKTEIKVLFFWMLEYVFKLSKVDFYLNPFREVPRHILWEDILSRLQTGEPIQYILGTCEFMGRAFKVSEAVLIPRPETVDLVSAVLCDLPRGGRVLDVGTGSGCIAISIKKERPDVFVSALDVSREALKICRVNAQTQGVEIDVKWGDVLTSELPDFQEKFDVLVSNPPYIPLREKETMADHVKNHEPQQALFVPDEDPLIFYRALAIELSRKYLKSNGFIFAEVHSPLSRLTEDVFLDNGFRTVAIMKDMFDRPRILKAGFCH